jgi:hypothetical protein
LQPASTRIVWRKADINGAGRESASPGPAARLDPTHAGTQVMRQTTSDSTSGSTGASVPPVMAPAHGSGGIDVARLAEQVSRIIARQLTIERERRGRTR